MSAVNQVILTDGTTPVTLKPDGNPSGGTFDFIEGSAVARKHAFKCRQIQSASRQGNKQYLRFTQPRFAVDASTGLLVQAGEPMYALIELTIPDDVSLSDRTQFVKRIMSSSLPAAFETPLVKGERTW